VEEINTRIKGILGFLLKNWKYSTLLRIFYCRTSFFKGIHKKKSSVELELMAKDVKFHEGGFYKESR
jgi:hypothetical protein